MSMEIFFFLKWVFEELARAWLHLPLPGIQRLNMSSQHFLLRRTFSEKSSEAHWLDFSVILSSNFEIIVFRQGPVSSWT